MKDDAKSKNELVEELSRLRRQVAEAAVLQTQGDTCAEARQMIRELQESKSRYQSLFEDAPVSLWEEDFGGVKVFLDDLQARGVTDLETYLAQHPQAVARCMDMVQIVDLNQASLAMYKASSKQELLHGFSKTFISKTDAGFAREIVALAKGNRVVETETVAQTLTGDTIYIKLVSTIRPGYEQTWERVLAATVDITKRRQVEEELREYAHTLGKRINELNCLYAISNLVNQPDLSLEDILEGIANLLPPAWQYPEITCAQIILEGQFFRTEPFRETVWKQASDIIAYGRRVGTVEVCYMEEKPEGDEGPFMKEEKSLLDAVAERVGRIVEHKRRQHTAEVLHDTVAQIMFRVGLEVEWCIEHRSSEKELLSRMLLVRRLVARSSDELRDAILALRSPYLVEHDNLIDLLNKQVTEFQSRSSVAATLITPPQLAFLSQPVCRAIYRIVHESLSNVHKHARASAVIVSLHCEQDEVTITVQDNGVGLADPTSLEERIGLLHFGVATMRQVVERARGDFCIANNEDQGVIVQARFPVAEGGLR